MVIGFLFALRVGLELKRGMGENHFEIELTFTDCYADNFVFQTSQFKVFKLKGKCQVDRVPTKVPYHPFNYRMAAAIFIRVVSRHDKVTMRYCMKPLTAPPGGKRWS
ncbi:hypothetical protein AVEN_49953-1 [Araneus ventricosus]|uniref:Uncharacterized protein n=1 Tax=Araneus ventricosus TaxID=182803 RepID=A0A4Y2EHC5_ARAVE|nr:hypothetical protein AVEN_49953-1 [Araneus ventricosus]